MRSAASAATTALAAGFAAALVFACAVAAFAPSDNVSLGQSTFLGTIARIDAATAKRMTGVSWRAGCPVPLRDLRLLTLSHWGFGGEVRKGRLIVHRDVARDMVVAFRRLYAAHFRVRRMVPIDAYRGNDYRSIEADNTSAFNCRYVEGTSRWSEHAFGRAIDVNPIENPYVSSGRSSHRASIPYVDRTPRRPGNFSTSQKSAHDFG